MTVGALFGAIATVDVLGAMCSALIFNTIYAKTLEVASTFFFLVIAAFYFVAGIFLLSVSPRLLFLLRASCNVYTLWIKV